MARASDRLALRYPFHDRSAPVIRMVKPLDLMEQHVGSPVRLLLKDGRQITGKLAGFDPYMNLVLEEAEETSRDGTRRSLGMLVLRGNNVVSLAPA